MAINSKQSKYSVFSSCILSFIHNKNTHNKSSHQIRKKGRKQKNFILKLKNSLLFLSSLVESCTMNILGQFTIHKGVKYSIGEEMAFLSVFHFTLWLFWHFLLFSLIIHYQHYTHTFVYLWI